MPRSVSAPPTPQAELVEAQRSVMVGVFRAAGLTRATFLTELASVARAAAAEGDYSAAMKGYELIGKGMGLLGNEKHLHLHGVGGVGGAGGDGADGLGMVRRMAALTDEQLEQLAAEREASTAEVLAVGGPGPGPGVGVADEALVADAVLEAELFS